MAIQTGPGIRCLSAIVFTLDLEKLTADGFEAGRHPHGMGGFAEALFPLIVRY